MIKKGSTNVNVVRGKLYNSSYDGYDYNAHVDKIIYNSQTVYQKNDTDILVAAEFFQRKVSMRVDSVGSIDDTFNIGTGFNSWVKSFIQQSDGKIIIGGSFTSFNGTSINRIARLNLDGSLDTSFNVGTGFNDTVESIIQQSNGKIIISGWFTSYNGTSANQIVRLNLDGSLDTGFNSGSGTGSGINLIKQQSDGKIIIGGSFTSFNGTSINRIARLNADGSLDTSFNVGTGFNDTVRSIIQQSDGKILVGGYFSTYNNNSVSRCIRLNIDGSFDINLIAPVSGFWGNGFYAVNSIAQQIDGKILVGGVFNSTYAGTPIFRFNTDGSLDTSFIGSSFGQNTVNCTHITVQSNGKIIISGSFPSLSTLHLVRLNSDGSLDNTFNVSNYISILNYLGSETLDSNNFLLQNDGKILIGNLIVTFLEHSNLNLIKRSEQDSINKRMFNFNKKRAQNNYGYRIKLQPDNKILVHEEQKTGIPSNPSYRFLSRINRDGSLDTTFNVGTLNNRIESIVQQTDGKIIIGGYFTSFNGTTGINRIARLNADGSLDTSFNVGTGFNNVVLTIIQQSDGKMIAVGGFTSFNGTSINRIARLNADGSLDTSFNVGTGFNSTVYSIIQQTDGKIVLVGAFNSFNDIVANWIARLNTDGSLDTTFNVGYGFNGTTTLIIQQTDGKILIFGGFTNFNGTNINRLARLNSDGSLDTSFNPGNGPQSFPNIFGIDLQSNGKIIIVGNFTAYNNTNIKYIARLNTNGSLDTTFQSPFNSQPLIPYSIGAIYDVKIRE